MLHRNHSVDSFTTCFGEWNWMNHSIYLLTSKKHTFLKIQWTQKTLMIFLILAPKQHYSSEVSEDGSSALHVLFLSHIYCCYLILLFHLVTVKKFFAGCQFTHSRQEKKCKNTTKSVCFWECCPYKLKQDLKEWCRNSICSITEFSSFCFFVILKWFMSNNFKHRMTWLKTKCNFQMLISFTDYRHTSSIKNTSNITSLTPWSRQEDHKRP